MDLTEIIGLKLEKGEKKRLMHNFSLWKARGRALSSYGDDLNEVEMGAREKKMRETKNSEDG